MNAADVGRTTKEKTVDEDQTDFSNGRRPRIVYERPGEADIVNPKLTLEECLERRAYCSASLSEISACINSIKNQLDLAEVTQTRTGIPTNPIWKQRAAGALRYYGRQHQDYSRALGNLSRRIIKLENIADNKSRAQAFIRKARALLPKETYLGIWSRVGVNAVDDFDYEADLREAVTATKGEMLSA